MRILLLIVVLVVHSYIGVTQNLVPNPSFEDTVACPMVTDQLNFCQSWSSYRNSPDYFNACSPGVNVPNSNFGFQYAHTGVSHIGIVTYRIQNSPNGPNYREFAGTPLSSALTVGSKYFISFYANFAFTSNVAIATNNIGIRLFTQGYSLSNPGPIDNLAQVNYQSLLTDSLNWIKISGSFIADSIYSHIAIGNFYSDQNTDSIFLGPLPNYSYYYIDDICLSMDSNYCNTWTSVVNIPDKNKTFQIFPNPTKGDIKIITDEIQTCKLFSMQYDLIYHFNDIKSDEFSFSIAELNYGPYLIQIITKYDIYHKVIIKN